ncbi:MAG TPA: hypothetical protein PK295_00375 [Candidatus Magasanikbacteria bacterium]|nr:hypothetical protein [Candidatus Magasanikbacteria bacterium]
MIFPPKKFQVRLAIIGAGVGVIGGLLVILLLNMCFANDSMFLCYLGTFMTYIFMYLPTITIGKICTANPSFLCLLFAPALFFAITFFIFGSILWVVKNNKNKV